MFAVRRQQPDALPRGGCSFAEKSERERIDTAKVNDSNLALKPGQVACG